MPDILTSWNMERVLALAPDLASAQAGQGLAAARKWTGLGRDGRALWGLCQGSGKNPYQTEIDLSDPSFKCTCPSRKFPCKHGLDLFLLACDQPKAVPETKPPPWVEEWITKRDERVEKRERRQETENDPEAQRRRAAGQEKRAANREAAVAAGMQELDR